MKILFFENIYEQYSKLEFTCDTDRSVGMAGLERRLVRTYKTRGGYGILHNFLSRSLLWQREDKSLQRIPYADNRRVPSWSWMAVKGAIKYMNVPFDTVDWNEDKIQSPFRAELNGGPGIPSVQPVGDLVAVARDLVPGNGGELIFDRPEETESIQNLKCVIIGTERLDTPADSQKHYVLIVAPLHSEEGNTDYERVGVAVVAKKDIKFEGSGIQVRIV